MFFSLPLQPLCSSPSASESRSVEMLRGGGGAEKDVLMVFLVQAEAEGAKGSLEKASSPCFSAEFLQAQKIMRLKQNLDKYCWLCAHL